VQIVTVADAVAKPAWAGRAPTDTTPSTGCGSRTPAHQGLTENPEPEATPLNGRSCRCRSIRQDVPDAPETSTVTHAWVPEDASWDQVSAPNVVPAPGVTGPLGAAAGAVQVTGSDQVPTVRATPATRVAA
jgi:hypothetical protein